MKSKAGTLAVVCGVLVLTSTALRPLAAPVWLAMQAKEPVLRPCSDTAVAGAAMVVGLLGGIRAAVADIVWLEACGQAEAHDLPATESLLQLVTVIDPRPLYFWLNGARIMAYDMPGWRIEAAGGYGRVPMAVQARWGREQAEAALRQLDEARRFHPGNAALWIEQANIQFNRLGDTAGAAESYRRAWEQPSAPYYAARLHAELLRRLGRKAEALAWLTRLYPELPPGDPAAGAKLVLARITELERELGIPRSHWAPDP